MTLVEKILKEALKLSVSERDELIESLLASRSADEGFAPGYDEEIARRIEEIKSGKVEGIPHSEMMARLKAKVKAVKNG